MKQEIEQIIRKNLPEERNGKLLEDKEWQPRVDDYQFGFNDCLAQINTSLIADEVLKVVVEKIEMLYGDIVTTKKDIAIPHNCIEYETALDDVVNLLSNLSPNKENK